MISDGEITLCQTTNKLDPLITLGPGEFFGEIPFLLDTKQSTSAISRSFSSIYTISRKDFLAILKDNADDYVNISSLFFF